WELHARLVRRSLERGFYQGWDLSPAQLPTRYGATYTFFREGARSAAERPGRYLSRRSAGILAEPATARARAGLRLRGRERGGPGVTVSTSELASPSRERAERAKASPAIASNRSAVANERQAQ